MTSTQFKLMLAFTGLIVLVMVVSGILAERSLREREMERIERSLTERARLVAELAGEVPFRAELLPALKAIADRAAAAAAVRVTLIDRSGVVLGDSDVPLERIPAVENHAHRPEVQAALQGKLGRSARRSETVGRRLFYLAIPAQGDAGVIRLAVDLSDMEDAVSDLRWKLFVAGSIGLLAALAISFPMTSITLRPIREMRRVLASIAGGELEQRLPLRWRDELGEISFSINRLAEQLRDRLDEATSEKERLQAVLNGMVEGVLVVDEHGSIVLANDRLRELYEVWTEVAGLSPLAAFRNAELVEILSEAAASPEPVLRELELGRAAPRVVHVHAVGFPAPPPRMGTVAVFHDVTEVVHLEQVRRDFVANASHELRTPLAAIRGFAETLISGGLSEEDRRSYIEIIDRHSRRLENIVADLLELSQAEGAEVSFERCAVDIGALAQGLLCDAAARFEKSDLEIGSSVEGDTTAWGDRRAIEQILINLIDNAVKYTGAGGRIEVVVDGGGERIRVAVRDTGIGIPAEDRERIFERFYRVDKARSRALGGTGLGLSIVKHLVQRMEGEISLESELDRGSIFIVSLPRPPGGAD